MKVSSKSDYGIRAMIELAHHYGKGRPTQSREIAIRQQIPESYLEQLLTILRRAGFVRSVRGPQGGHALIRDPQGLRVCEIIEAMEGAVMPIDCLDEGSQCTRSGGCAQRDMWEEVRQALLGVLNSTTIADLALKDKQANLAGGRYSI